MSNEDTHNEITGALTVGQLRALLDSASAAGLADDTHVVIGDTEGEWFNVGEVIAPGTDGIHMAFTLMAVDTFDPRQF